MGTYIGGPRPRDELERAVPEVPGQRPGSFVVELDGALIGIVTLDRRAPERLGYRPGGGEAELATPSSVGIRVRHRGVRGGTRLVRRRASRIGRPASRTTRPLIGMRAARSLGKDTLARSSAGTGTGATSEVAVPELWAGTDAGKTEHHCMVIDAEGQRRLSRRVANDKTVLLDWN